MDVTISTVTESMSVTDLLSPCVTSLEVSVTDIHSWEGMCQAAVQLLELYGSDVVEVEVDYSKSLMMAVMYLQTAIKLTNQRARVTTEILVLCADKSLSSPCIDDVQQILTPLFSLTETAVATVPVIGGSSTGSSGSKNTPIVAATGPTGRDALFILSAIMREVDRTWLDGVYSDLQWDLHHALKKTSTTYATQCCLQHLPASMSTPPSVTLGAVYSLWVSSPPSQSDNTNDTTDSKNQWTSASSGNAGSFNYVTGYFVIGTPIAADDTKGGVKGKAPPILSGTGGGGSSNNTGPAAAAEPVLKQVVLWRTDVIDISMSAVRLVEAIKSVTKDTQEDNHQSIVTSFSDLLIQVYSLLKHRKVIKGSLPEGIRFESVVEGLSYSVKVTIQSSGRSCQIPLSELVALKIADIFTVAKGCDGTVDATLCDFFRLIFAQN